MFSSLPPAKHAEMRHHCRHFITQGGKPSDRLAVTSATGWPLPTS
jgi:hypothetical protein